MKILNIPDPPSVVLLTPQSGETYSSNPIIIRWETSDPDSDTLKFSLFYWDGGHWISIIANLIASEHSWDTQDKPSGAYYRIRVVVSDGVLIGIDELSSPFSIEKSHWTGIEVIWVLSSIIIIAAISRTLVSKKPRT